MALKRKQSVIRTKRLNIYPLTDSEIRQLIDNCADEDLAGAYYQMLDGCTNDPHNRQWYAPWTMETREGNIRIGDLGFKGPAVSGSVEIGYGINKEFEGQGYTTEAAQAMVDWALEEENVLFVEAEADENNAASIHILEKLGFTMYGYGEEGPRFVKPKSETAFTSIGMCLGICLGLSVGMTIFDNMTTGLCIGLGVGLCLGAAKDKRNRERMDEIIKTRYGIDPEINADPAK